MLKMIDAKLKKLFFDNKKVISAVDKTSRRVMCRFGALVRTIAKRSIRKRKKASAPGKPPSSHTGLLKKFIWFGYEPGSKNVVIGPARLSGKNRGEAPSLLEHGDEFPARPFMGPALEKAQPSLSKIWKDSIR